MLKSAILKKLCFGILLGSSLTSFAREVQPITMRKLHCEVLELRNERSFPSASNPYDKKMVFEVKRSSTGKIIVREAIVDDFNRNKEIFSAVTCDEMKGKRKVTTCVENDKTLKVTSGEKHITHWGTIAHWKQTFVYNKENKQLRWKVGYTFSYLIPYTFIDVIFQCK